MANSLNIDTKIDGGNYFAKATQLLRLEGRPGFQRTESWGNVIKKKVFDDIDMLENGNAREYISAECLSPTTCEREWKMCFLERLTKKSFKLFDEETHKFLLSALQVDDNFYISQYEDFSEDTMEVPNSRFIAVLKRTLKTPNYKLFYCGCEGCDADSYSCTRDEVHDQKEKDDDDDDGDGVGVDRQLLADITHQVKRIAHVAAEMRHMKVVLPAILSDKRSRVVWCPRVNGGETPTGSTPRQDKTRPVTVASPTSDGTKEMTYEEPTSEMMEDDRVIIMSKLPEWNHELRSLVLKFEQGGRVQSASSKNFLMVTGEDQRAVLQFGKNKKGRFALDFRFPMSPVQAFAICLSTCNWTIPAKEAVVHQ